MDKLSERTLLNYNLSWNYIKKFITDINNVEQTKMEINSIKFTSQQKKPVSEMVRRNYYTALMHQIRDKTELRDEYGKIIAELKINIKKQMESQTGTELIREKLKDLSWADILKYKDDIIKNKKISNENKLLIRLYTDLPYPARNDYAAIRIFIDEPRPATFTGNCIMLTRKPIKHVPRKKVVIKKTVELTDDECEAAEFYPVRNIVWISEFKTAKHYSDIIQPIPDILANDIIQYCIENKVNTLFNPKPVNRPNCVNRYADYAVSKRICYMFYQVSKRKIGINVLRHLKIMDEYKDTPMLSTRKQTANMMGHSVNMQELYRIKV